MENVRSVKITLEVDTNKRTVSKTFSNISEMEDWLEENEDVADMVGYFDMDGLEEDSDHE